MTQRDQKTLLILVLSVVGAGIAFMVLQSWFLGPLGDYNRQIDNFTGDVQKKELEYHVLMRDLPLLKEARLHSLPVNQAKALNDYDKYLKQVCASSGLTDFSVTPQPAAEPKTAQLAGGPATKKPGHVVLKFGVHAKGSLSAVVKALDYLERTPVLHRINSMSISRQETSAAKKDAKDQLTLDLGIDALIAAGTPAEFAPTLVPDPNMKLPTPVYPRRYATEIASKNIFVGYQPPRAPEAEPEDPTIDIIPQQVRLTYTAPDAQEATLRNLLSAQTREMRLRSSARSGFNKFQIRNDEGNRVLIDATVLRIDQRDVYFQVKEDIYGIHIGQTIANAMRRALSQKELDDLQLTSLIKEYDPKTDPSRTDAKKTTKARGAGGFQGKGGFTPDGGGGFPGKNKGGFGDNQGGGKGGKGGFGGDGQGGFRGKGKKGGADDGARLVPRPGDMGATVPVLASIARPDAVVQVSRIPMLAGRASDAG
jgi:hypothetical protein